MVNDRETVGAAPVEPLPACVATSVHVPTPTALIVKFGAAELDTVQTDVVLDVMVTGSPMFVLADTELDDPYVESDGWLKVITCGQVETLVSGTLEYMM